MSQSNKAIITLLNEFAEIHQIKGETFKARAYQNAVKLFQTLDKPLTSMTKEELMELEGIGKAIASKVVEFGDTGSIEALEKQRASVPPGLVELLQIDGLGPKKVKLLQDKIGVESLADLEQALEEGKLDSLSGFGKKSVENLVVSIERFKRYAGRTFRAEALPIAEEIVDDLRTQFDHITEIEIAGSLRRKRETIGDIDILVQSTKAAPIMEYFTSMGKVETVLASGEKKSSVIITGDMQIDIRVIDGPEFYSHLQYFTGSKEHNVKLRQLAITQGYRLNEYGLKEGETYFDLRSEAEIYAKLGLNYILPELREDRGEIEAAGDGNLPDLVTIEQVVADLHVHSDWSSDAISHLEDMIQKEIDIGHQYIVLTDHTQDHVLGLDEIKIQEQIQVIKELDRKYSQIALFTGAELNIRKNGEVDIEEETLKLLDFAIASIHSNFNMPEKVMTERITSAMEYSKVLAIAHPTTRTFRVRDPIEMDLDEIVERAVETNTALEINGTPSRMDLPDHIIHHYKDSGLKFTLGSDAHNIHQLLQIDFAVDQARRGWLERHHILNTMTVEEFKSYIG